MKTFTAFLPAIENGVEGYREICIEVEVKNEKAHKELMEEVMEEINEGLEMYPHMDVKQVATIKFVWAYREIIETQPAGHELTARLKTTAEANYCVAALLGPRLST